MRAVRRTVGWLMALVVIATLALMLWAGLRGRSQDVPWAPLDLGQPVGGAGRVETIYRHRFPGLHFRYEPNPTQSLPRRPGLIYFQVDRDAEPEEWRQVVESRSLAIRVNDRYIVGDIQDRTALAIRTAGGQEIGIEFTLYVVAKGPGRGPAGGDGA